MILLPDPDPIDRAGLLLETLGCNLCSPLRIRRRPVARVITAAVYCWNARGEVPEFRSRASCRIRGVVMIVLLAQLSAEVAASEGMPIAPGDVLRVSIDGGPELGREAAKVGADGRIMLPGLDTIGVAGLDLDAVRERIESVLVTREIIREPVVSVEVVNYRPFYVGGAVANPGAIPYEPGLTVRHALILAGGLDRSDTPKTLSVVDLVELKAKHRSVEFALVEVRSRMARLEAELAEAAAPDFSGLAPQVGGAAEDNPILSIDSELFRDRMTALSANQDHLREVIALLDLEIDVLAQQASLQQEEMSVQNDQFRNARTLVEQGVLPLTRLQEQEREASRLSRDLLENQSFAARARQNKQSSLYEIEAAETRRRIELRDALREAALDLARLEAEKEVISAALVSAGVMLMDESLGAELQPRIVVNRTTDGAAEAIVADMDTPILPGDVLEVSLAVASQG